MHKLHVHIKKLRNFKDAQWLKKKLQESQHDTDKSPIVSGTLISKIFSRQQQKDLFFPSFSKHWKVTQGSVKKKL